jgi:hypothetical protein|tara:strand:+ start:622 stop:897 length:276 start_codon:yes stop_codon:yes gene_type:complete
MNKQTIQALPTSELERFTELYLATESENAYMDGECSQKEGDKRYKEAIREFTVYLHRLRMDGDYEGDMDFTVEVWELLRQADKELEKRKGK